MLRQTLCAGQADAVGVQATLRTGLGAVERGYQNADVMQAFEALVSAHADDRFQGQAAATNLLFQAAWRGAQAVIATHEFVAEA